MSLQFEVKEIFPVPQEKAFDALLDLDAAKHWMEGLVGMERLDEGPMKLGSEWKETRKMYGTVASEYFEVVELERPNKIVLHVDGTKGTTGKGFYIYTYTLRSIDEGTEVTLQGEISGLTGLAKVLGKLMKNTFAKAAAKELVNLKNYLEQTK